jgi:hypothetical protein
LGCSLSISATTAIAVAAGTMNIVLAFKVAVMFATFIIITISQDSRK